MRDPIRRAETALLLGRQLFLLGGEEPDVVYARALEELGDADAELARRLEAGLITNHLFAPSGHGAALTRLERVRDQADASTLGQKLLLSLLAYHDALRCSRGRDRAARAARARTGSAGEDRRRRGLRPGCTVLAMADLDEVLVIYEDALAEAHRRGSTFAFAAVKVFRADACLAGDLGERRPTPATPWPRARPGSIRSLRRTRDSLPCRRAHGAGQA
jgi:hypothetical protein